MLKAVLVVWCSGVFRSMFRETSVVIVVVVAVVEAVASLQPGSQEVFRMGVYVRFPRHATKCHARICIA